MDRCFASVLPAQCGIVSLCLARGVLHRNPARALQNSNNMARRYLHPMALGGNGLFSNTRIGCVHPSASLVYRCDHLCQKLLRHVLVIRHHTMLATVEIMHRSQTRLAARQLHARPCETHNEYGFAMSSDEPLVIACYTPQLQVGQLREDSKAE